jgi:hypothetical protein
VEGGDSRDLAMLTLGVTDEELSWLAAARGRFSLLRFAPNFGRSLLDRPNHCALSGLYVWAFFRCYADTLVVVWRVAK